MNKDLRRPVWIVFLIVCVGTCLAGKKNRSELEYRVEELEKQNAQLRQQIEELQTKLELIQARLDSCAGPSESMPESGGFAPARSMPQVPGNLEVVKIKPEQGGQKDEPPPPLVPKIKHYISSGAESDVTSLPGSGGSVTVYKASEGEKTSPEPEQVVILAGGTEENASAGSEQAKGKLIVVKQEDFNASAADLESVAQNKEETTPPSDEKSGEKSAGVSGKELKAYEQYQQALTFYTEKQLQQAKEGFQAFINAYPESSYLPNAYYWLGECYFDGQDYKKAQENFAKVAREYPRSEKAAEALYKLGLCQLNHNQLEQAVDTLEEVRLLYPYSDAAKRAEEKLKELTE